MTKILEHICSIFFFPMHIYLHKYQHRIQKHSLNWVFLFTHCIAVSAEHCFYYQQENVQVKTGFGDIQLFVSVVCIVRYARQGTKVMGVF